MKTTICAEELRELDPCEEGYQTFIEAHGSETVKLSEALESNGLEDVCWLLDKLELSGQEERDLRDFARGQAAINLEKIVPYCSIEEYSTICSWVLKGDESARDAAKDAAMSAACSVESAGSAAWGASSARSAISSVRSAAWSAAGSAARSAASSAARSVASSASSIAWSAALSVALSAGSAAWSVAMNAKSAAWSATYSASRSAFKNILLSWEAEL